MLEAEAIAPVLAKATLLEPAKELITCDSGALVEGALAESPL
jgi:hypothetical protein